MKHDKITDYDSLQKKSIQTLGNGFLILWFTDPLTELKTLWLRNKIQKRNLFFIFVADPHNLRICCSDNYTPSCKFSGAIETFSLQTTNQKTEFEVFKKYFVVTYSMKVEKIHIPKHQKTMAVSILNMQKEQRCNINWWIKMNDN